MVDLLYHTEDFIDDVNIFTVLLIVDSSDQCLKKRIADVLMFSYYAQNIVQQKIQNVLNKNTLHK